MTAIQRLNELERIEHMKTLEGNPRKDMFEMLAKKHSDKNANSLTQAVIRWIQLNGGFARRISTTGRYIEGKEYSKGFYGAGRTKGKWIKGSGVLGSADISATLKDNKGNTIAWEIEIKIGKDRQSEHQKIYQKNTENAGGVYSIVRNFDDFIKEWEGLVG